MGGHLGKSKYINKVKARIKPEKQQDIDLDCDTVRKIIRRTANWKAPGPDGVPGYWIKNFTSLHGRITEQLNKCLREGKVPGWMTTGRTILLVKDVEKGNEVDNYRPITCLPLIWKLLTGVISDAIYDHLERSKLLPEEQKGCRKNCRGSKDHLLIDKAVLKNCKRRTVGLSMV